jgi:serine/threonine-protein kinase RsbW
MASRMAELITSWPIDDRPSPAGVGVYRIVTRSDGVKPRQSGYLSEAMNVIVGSASPSEPLGGPTRFRRDHLAADAHAVGRVRSDFDWWLHAHFGLSAASRIDLTLAVNEAVSNAAEHAYFGSPCGAGSFDVDAHYDAARDILTVVVEDRGRWRFPDPPTGPLSARGRGIELMRALADDVSIDTTSAGTCVRLTWLHMQNRPEA